MRCLWRDLQENKEQYFDSYLPGVQARIFSDTPEHSRVILFGLALRR